MILLPTSKRPAESGNMKVTQDLEPSKYLVIAIISDYLWKIYLMVRISIHSNWNWMALYLAWGLFYALWFLSVCPFSSVYWEILLLSLCFLPLQHWLAIWPFCYSCHCCVSYPKTQLTFLHQTVKVGWPWVWGSLLQSFTVRLFLEGEMVWHLQGAYSRRCTWERR